jgi:hypothetical protein
MPPDRYGKDLPLLPRRWRRALPQLLAAAFALPALAQTAPEPQVTVTLAPDGPVIAGTPVEVTATLLVPTWMPRPPDWPDLQIADAITRLPERATRPVTQRVGDESWSGLARTWEIVPQRPADFDLGAPPVTVTYANPETSAPVETTVSLPEIAFTATVPPGAEGIDPFLAATALTVEARFDGLPESPKPGDAFTLTLVTTASGPPAILLPPLAPRLPTPPGLHAYPRQPTLADSPGGPPTATRSETVSYVIQEPGTYALPAVGLDWWDTASESRQRAETAPISITVPPPAGWRDAARSGPSPAALLALGAVVLVAAAVAVVLWRRRTRPPSEAGRYRRLRRAIRHGTPAEIRARLSDWQDARQDRSERVQRAIEAPLHDLDRLTYGPARNGTPEQSVRAALLVAVADARSSSPDRRGQDLPALNPCPAGIQGGRVLN